MSAIRHSLKYVSAVGRSPFGLAVLMIISLSLAGVVRTRQVLGNVQDIQKLNRFVQTPRTNPAAMKALKEGRDLIERER